MHVLTENDIKKMLAQGEIIEKGSFTVGKNYIVTPSARSYLNDKNITLHFKEQQSKEGWIQMQDENISSSHLNENKNEEFDTLFGARLSKKPEIMTHLRGNLLVFKDHPRIGFRGAIDSLESEIILVQILAQKQGLKVLVDDLEEVITFIRKLIRCEVSGDKMDMKTLQNLSEDELREHSHHPSKYYGIKHFLPTYQHGEIVAALNKLRTKTREAEIAAYKAFKDEYGQVSREDIIKSLNRLSSLFWVMMFKYLTDKYK